MSLIVLSHELHEWPSCLFLTFYDICFFIITTSFNHARRWFCVYILPHRNLDWRKCDIASRLYCNVTICWIHAHWASTGKPSVGEGEKDVRVTSCQLDKQKQSVIDKMSSNYASNYAFDSISLWKCWENSIMSKVVRKQAVKCSTGASIFPEML